MTKITSLPTIAAALLAFGLSAAPAAALERTFVSGKGTDAGTCALAAPCRTFAFALTQTNVGAEVAGGEIDVLDPADYGPVTITKAINIINDGVGTAGILVAGSGLNAVTINAGASDFVHLRGLTIAGLSGGNGILFNTGGSFAIENCVIWGFNNSGIIIVPTGSAVVTGVLSKVITTFNGNGILVDSERSTGGSLNVTIVDSVASNNANSGISADSGFRDAVAATVMVRNSVASYNGYGLVAARGAAIIRVAHSVITGNGSGVAIGGGKIFSYGDNDIDGNAGNSTNFLTPLAMH